MTIGPFLSDDTGFKTLLSTGSWAVDEIYAVLVTTSQTVNRGDQTYASISSNVVADTIKAVPGRTVTEDGSNSISFTHTKIIFTASGTISGRYVYYLFGDTTPAAGDVVIGYVDLYTEGGNISSASAEFSYTPAASGLFTISRSVAA